MPLSLITLARLCEEIAYHAMAAKLLATHATNASAQHLKNVRSIHAQIGELLADAEKKEAA